MSSNTSFPGYDTEALESTRLASIVATGAAFGYDTRTDLGYDKGA
jgi:hypothetical protein